MADKLYQELFSTEVWNVAEVENVFPFLQGLPLRSAVSRVQDYGPFVENKSPPGLGETGIRLAFMQNVAQSKRSGTTTTEEAKKMAAITLYTCLCGVQKKTSNHWVLAKVSDSGITFMPWDAELARRGDIVVLCGEGCAASMLSRSLGDWKKPVAGVTCVGSVTDSSAEYELAVA
jgi:hypothetical protein